MNQVITEFQLATGQRLQVVEGDLTLERVDAIVNAANRYLNHGGGVAGAIVRRGGASIQKESNEWVRQHGAVTQSEPAYTRAGLLPCRYVIHAVGPIWGEGDEDAKLAAAVGGALRQADQLELTSLALPAISTGIYGFPKQRAARIILSAILEYFIQNPPSSLQLVRITLFDRATVDEFITAWEAVSRQGSN